LTLLGHQTCTNRRLYNLYCVGADVKPYSINQSISGLQFRRWQYGSIFIRSAVIASETREMSRNSKWIWPHSCSRSSKIIDLGVNGKPICDFLL